MSNTNLAFLFFTFINVLRLTRLQCHCIVLDKEDDPNLITTMLHEIHDPDYLVKPHDWAAYNADMCALTQKYGLEDSNVRHRFVFLDTMNKEKWKSSYPLTVALVCGPDSSEYADTKLPEQVFKRCLEDAKDLLKDNKTFFKMLVEGKLFNTKFAGRFAAGMAGFHVSET